VRLPMDVRERSGRRWSEPTLELVKIGALRRIPVMKLLAMGEVVLLARDHVTKLDHDERHRLVELLRIGRGRTRNLTPQERRELSELVGKAEPRLFLGEVAEKLSPFPIPDRFTRGRRRS
jgi:hypothetical protein